jgi:uncharacterized protein
MEKLNFNVSDVGDDGLLINTEKPPAFFSDLTNSLYTRDNIELNSNILIKASVEKTDKQIYLNGYISLEIKSSCSRCLTMVSTIINPHFNLLLVPENTDQDEFIFDSETVVESYKGNTVDITDYLYEILSVSIPVKMLCSKLCKGLCVYCGGN